MKRSWIISIVCVVLAVVGGLLIWTLTASKPADHGAMDMPASPETATPSESTPVEEASASVTIKDFAYSPATIKVKKGTTVTWTNEDTVRHNVISRAAIPMGPPTTHDLLAKGETYSFTFMATGTFDYGCTPHPNMKGTVEVID